MAERPKRSPETAMLQEICQVMLADLDFEVAIRQVDEIADRFLSSANEENRLELERAAARMSFALATDKSPSLEPISRHFRSRWALGFTDAQSELHLLIEFAFSCGRFGEKSSCRHLLDQAKSRLSATGLKPRSQFVRYFSKLIESCCRQLESGAFMETINFYLKDAPYGEFSNFAAFPIDLDGERWPTSEHYFQAQKFEDAGYRQKIREAKSPMQAARLGRDRSQKLRADWENVKDGIMRQAVLAKFTQHENLKTLLLSTGDAKLVEHTENDAYWGDGGDGSGKNMLGRILMDVREQLCHGNGSDQSGK